MKASINDLILNTRSEKLIENLNADVFTERNEMDVAIFRHFEKGGLISSHLISSLFDPLGNCVAYVYEHTNGENHELDYYTILKF